MCECTRLFKSKWQLVEKIPLNCHFTLGAICTQLIMSAARKVERRLLCSQGDVNDAANSGIIEIAGFLNLEENRG
ncbi:hypothetical protein V22_16120 [Calycomorphotria hydatis]|uniref:Uncharacterized protein n=1 Tax=Calycomorphotria hydatis TaxID=2528027 RepID=A0A517T7M2_9PLAN|nr:hypothetical protein V22_16120 [Calycomorphotria hydatis]